MDDSVGGMLRPAMLAFGCALVVSGCRACEALPTPPGQGQNEKRPSGLAKLPAPDNLRLHAPWRAASAGLAIEAAGAASEAIRYRVRRDCRRKYQSRHLMLSEVAPGRPLMGNETVAQYTVDALAGHPRRVRWQLLDASTVRIAEGKVGSPSAGASQHAAELETSGEDWHELAGPHLMWSVYTTQAPLSITHPALPMRVTVGSQTTWTQRYYPQAAARALRRRRQAVGGRPLPTPHPLTRQIDVSVGGWFSLAGAERPLERVVVLVASWEEEEVGDSPLVFERNGRFKARYVISEYGHVIHAIILSRNNYWSSARPGEAMEKDGLVEFELRLVDSCVGHVLTPHRLGNGAARQTLDAAQ